MKMFIFRSCYRHLRTLLYTLPLVFFASQANSANIYAYVDTEGKLLVSEQKSDARYVRFDPKRRITSQISPRVVSHTSPRISARMMPRATSWTATPIASRFASGLAPQMVANETTIDIPIHRKALRYTPLINDIAEEIGVSANLLHAIIQVESAYNPGATSPKGAQGLMQLIPATAERFGVERSYDPAANIRGGARYIKNLLARFDNNLKLALAAYNSGEGTVQKYNNTIPPYPETQAYVTRVLSLFEKRGE